MRKPTLIALLCLFVAAIAANAQMKVKPPQPGQPGAGSTPIVVSGAQPGAQQFKRISQEDALKLYKEGRAVFVDVRSNEQFQLGHIKDALSIPGSQIVRRRNEMDVKLTVITYCACSEEQSSGRAATDLTVRGVQNVYALKGGWADWKSNGHPTAVGPK